LTADDEATARGPPRRIGPYEIISRIGAGGMGQVYLATDPRLGRKVALKILPAELTNDEELVRRLAQEARTASALNHPNIVTIHELGKIDSSHYIVQEYVEGETLRQRMLRTPLSLDESLEITRQLASALRAAHGAGVIHRDIKPDNIMLRRDGLVKVLDFGLAKLADISAHTQVQTATGVILGTGYYMSPEQARGEDLDARTDIWSLGVVLYEMLARRRPFEGRTFSDTVSLILQKEPEPPTGMPPHVQRLVSKTLAKQREDRYATAEELLADLQTPPVPARRYFGVLAGAIAAAAVIGGVFLARRDEPKPEPQIKSVAVMPFTNLSGSAENEYLSDGITEEIISALARVPNLKVVSRTSAFAFKGKSGDIREVAEKLGVSSIVEGSVRRAGNRLRVVAQLVNARDGYQMWSDSYDRELTDIFAIQSDIAGAVAGALRARMTPMTPPTRDFEAYEAYLKGRQSSSVWTREGLETSVAYYRRALDRDRSFSLAWAGLADAYSMMDHRRGASSLAPAESYRLAVEAAERALDLDPASAEAHAALGHIYTHTGRFAEAERHARRAVELNPSSGMAHLWYATYLRTQRRFPEAKRHFLRAREADPYSALVAQLGGTAWTWGDYEMSLDFTRRGLEIGLEGSQLHLINARVHALQGRFAEADALLQKAARLPDLPPGLDEERALVRAIEGRREEALALLQRLRREKKNVHELMMMRAWAAAGDLDSAAASAQRLVKDQADYVRVNFDLPDHPAFKAFLADPRYHQARRDLGLQPI